MKKPEFPNPRLIHEDFLPNEPMKNYRIKKVTNGDTTRYFPQERNMRTLWRWDYVFALDVDFDGGYDTLEEAQQTLCSYCRRAKVEYLDFDPNVDCK